VCRTQIVEWRGAWDAEVRLRSGITIQDVPAAPLHLCNSAAPSPFPSPSSPYLRFKFTIGSHLNGALLLPA